MRETNPYKSVRQYESRIMLDVSRRMFVVCRDFIQDHLKLKVDEKKLNLELKKAEFKLGGKVYINPKTGKPLTKKEWDTIKKSLDTAFRFVYDKSTEEAIARKAVVLGKILTTMHTDMALDMKKLNEEAQIDYSFIENEIGFAEQHAGELITGLADNSRKRVISEIIQGQRERIGPRELETRLFRTYININRDWRRIAQTEIATNVNTGFVMTELNKGTKYLQGISGASACPFCKEYVDGQVVVIGDSSNSTGFVFDKTLDKEVPYVWPGKSNYGRSRRDWWVSAGAQHPNCRCAWQNYEPGFDEYDKKLEDRLAAMLAEEGVDL